MARAALRFVDQRHGMPLRTRILALPATGLDGSAVQQRSGVYLDFATLDGASAGGRLGFHRLLGLRMLLARVEFGTGRRVVGGPISFATRRVSRQLERALLVCAFAVCCVVGVERSFAHDPLGGSATSFGRSDGSVFGGE